MSEFGNSQLSELSYNPLVIDRNNIQKLKSISVKIDDLKRNQKLNYLENNQNSHKMHIFSMYVLYLLGIVVAVIIFLRKINFCKRTTSSMTRHDNLEQPVPAVRRSLLELGRVDMDSDNCNPNGGVDESCTNPNPRYNFQN